MQKSSLIQLLRSLDEREIKNLGKFVVSPYFNSNRKIVQLYKLLVPYYPAFDSAALSKRNLFKRLYGSKNYVEGTMKYLLSELEAIVKTFIAIENRNEIMSDVTILNEFVHKGLFSLFRKHHRTVKKKLNLINDPNNLFHFLVSDIYISYTSMESSQGTKKDIFREEWFNAIDEAIKFFLKAVLDNILFLYNYKRNVNEAIEVPIAETIIEFLEKEPKYREDEDIRIFLLQIKVLMKKDDKAFSELKMILEKNKNLKETQKINIINSIQYYYTAKLLAGEDHNREELEIIKLKMRHKVFVTGNNLRIDVFYKTFMLGIALREFDWARDFLNKYSKYLDEKHIDNAVQYGRARLHYQDKEYGKALTELAKIKSYNFVHYKPAVKILQMMIYFDMKLLSEAEDSAKTFQQFLRNDKLITSDIKRAYNRFAKLYLKLINTVSAGKLSKKNDLKFEIETGKELLIGRKWFLERVLSS